MAQPRIDALRFLKLLPSARPRIGCPLRKPGAESPRLEKQESNPPPSYRTYGCTTTLFSIARTPTTCSAATRAASFSASECNDAHNLTVPPCTVAFKEIACSTAPI